LSEQNTNIALRNSDYAYILETGYIKLEGMSADLLNDDKVKELYLGISKDGRINFKDAHKRSEKSEAA
jgi:branched-chain amino acid transport system ATP-binding protein